ncbi:MAG TPA: sigma factor-like helix-turn-helix DNA-binding protein [Polyangiaceae bacterium]|nr:sigma factor-like helix-turn-helix DNA-binding protein [Polyangiaceae bacterium]
MTKPGPLAPALWADLPSGLAPAGGPSEGLERSLEALWAAARAAWPGLATPWEAFAPYLARRLPEAASLDEALAQVRVADLYLACACAREEPRALAAFGELAGADVAAVARRFDASGGAGDELWQTVQAALFVAAAGEGKKIERYGGRGSLRAWVSVVAAREALRLGRRLASERPVEEAAMTALADERAGGSDDGELDYLKGVYRAPVRRAFEESLAALSGRERSLLRYRYVEGLSSEELALTYKVHRVTVNRWLEAARHRLWADMRTRLRQSLRVGLDEVDSVLRLVQSRLELSLSHQLRSGAGGEREG